MKKFRYALISAISALLLAQAAQAADLKIGFVNPIKVLEDANEVKSANARLEREFEPRQRRIENATRELRRMEERLTKDENTMTVKDAEGLSRDIRAKRREIGRMQDEFREDYNIRRSEELDKLQKNIYKAIESLAKQDGYDLIVGEGVIFASDKVDITDSVLERLNR